MTYASLLGFMPITLLAVADQGTLSVVTEYFTAGGWMMWVIFILSLFGSAIFLERAFDLYVLRGLQTTAYVSRIIALLEKRRYREALDACTVRSKHPLVAVLQAGLLRANRREKDIERAMEDRMLEALPSLQKRVSIMAVLANMATLLGLLGTIFGLIAAFSGVAAASAAARQEALAAGISQAMYTTAFGISVAVPLLLFHHLLSRRLETVLLETESGATSLLVALTGLRQPSDVDHTEL